MKTQANVSGSNLGGKYISEPTEHLFGLLDVLFSYYSSLIGSLSVFQTEFSTGPILVGCLMAVFHSEFLRY